MIALVCVALAPGALVTPGAPALAIRRAPRAAVRMEGGRDAQEPLFKLFMKREGIVAESLDLSAFGLTRGTRALEDIALGDVLVKLPRAGAMDLGALRQVPVPDSLVSADCWRSLPWFAQLGLWVLSEQARGSESKWAAYVDLLPLEGKALDTPYRWTDAELRALAYPLIPASVGEQRELMSAMHAAIVNSAPQSRVTVEALACACESVLSRAFPTGELLERAGGGGAAAGPLAGLMGALGGGGGGGGGEPGAALVARENSYALFPAIDAINHRSGAKTLFSYDEREATIVLRCGEAFKRGEQVFIEYGQKSNDELLLLYGFVEADNPFDSYSTAGIVEWARAEYAPVRAMPPAEWEARLEALRAAGLDGAADAGSVGATGASVEVLAAMRCLLDSGGAARASAEGAAAAYAAAPVAHEPAVLSALTAFCRMRARELPTRKALRDACAGSSASRVQTIGAFVNAKRTTLRGAESTLKRALDAARARPARAAAA